MNLLAGAFVLFQCMVDVELMQSDGGYSFHHSYSYPCK